MSEENKTDIDGKKKSFRDTILIVFVILVCFGLTIFGISVLLTSMSTGDLLNGASDDGNMITSDIVTPRVITDPNDGGIITIFDNNSGKLKIDKPAGIVKLEEKKPIVAKKPKPVSEPKKSKPVAVKKPVKADKKVVKSPKPNVVVAKLEENKLVVYSEIPEPGSATVGKFVLQLMAVRSESDANKSAEKYRSACPDIFVVRVDMKDGGVWYRVRCGITNSMDEVVALKQKLARENKINADVIKNR